MAPTASTTIAAAVALLASGVLKLIRPDAARAAIRTVGGPGGRSVVRLLGSAEVAVGTWALATGGRGATLAVVGIYLGFALFVWRLRTVSGGTTACGCFGSSGAAASLAHIWVNLFVAVVAALSISEPFPGLGPMLSGGGNQAAATLALASIQLVALITVVSRRSPRVAVAPPAASDVAPASVPGEFAPRALSGVDPRGHDIEIPLTGRPGRVAVVFLSSTCVTCQPIWDGLAGPDRDRLPRDVTVVVATRGPETERPATVARLSGSRPRRGRASSRRSVTVVMSDTAWRSASVPGAPYLVVLDGPTGAERARRPVTGWSEVVSAIDVLNDADPVDTRPPQPPAPGP